MDLNSIMGLVKIALPYFLSGLNEDLGATTRHILFFKFVQQTKKNIVNSKKIFKNLKIYIYFSFRVH